MILQCNNRVRLDRRAALLGVANHFPHIAQEIIQPERLFEDFAIHLA